MADEIIKEEEEITPKEITPVEGVHFNPLFSPPAITSESLKTETPIDLPEPPVDNENYQGIIDSGQAGVDATKSNEQAPAPSSLDDIFKQYLGETTPPPSTLDTYKQEATSVGLDVKQTEYNKLYKQMAELSAEASAVPIAIQQESTGRGVTAGGVKPLQTARLRNIALRSLPLQAQLDAAQNDLTSAQNKLNTMFKIKADDAINQYNYKNKLIDSVYNFATKKEQGKLDEQKQENLNKFTLKRDAISNQQSLVATAINNGQGKLAAQIGALDVASPTYKADLAKLQAQFIPEGFNYVSTPAERDRLKAEGYEIMQIEGRTYAKAPELTDLETYEAKKKIDAKYDDGDKVSISDQLAAKDAGYDIDEEGNLVKQGINTITSPSGKSYDMSTYAKDPAQANTVQNYIDNIGKLETIEDIDNYIQSNSANSPITGQMIANASTNMGIGWEELTALIQHEGLLGTSNVSIKNNNPGGITWSQPYEDSHPGVTKGTARPEKEGGNYVKFDTMQDGVNAVAEQLARRVTTSTGSDAQQDVPSDVFLAATQLVTRLTKGKGTTEYKEEILANVLSEYKKGNSLDDIEDNLRYSSVSEEFVGSFKGAFEFITKKGFSLSDREAAKDGLDELLADGDVENARYFMLGLARDKGTSDEKKQVVGREEALLAVDSINDALTRYKDAGGETGLITGSLEKIQQKVLKRTGNQDLANIANEIQIAIQAYRHAISGAAFTTDESIEYENIYPSIGKSKELNAAKIASLIRVYERNQGAFYKRTMGAKFYNELFEEPGENINTDGVEQTNQIINIQGQELSVGTIIQNDRGDKGRVEADGSITIIK